MILQNRAYWLRQLGLILSDVERANYGILTDRARGRIIEGYAALIDALDRERAEEDCSV